MKKQLKNFTVRLSASTREELLKQANKESTNEGALVRKAIINYLNGRANVCMCRR